MAPSHLKPLFGIREGLWSFFILRDHFPGALPYLLAPASTATGTPLFYVHHGGALFRLYGRCARDAPTPPQHRLRPSDATCSFAKRAADQAQPAGHRQPLCCGIHHRRPSAACQPTYAPASPLACAYLYLFPLPYPIPIPTVYGSLLHIINTIQAHAADRPLRLAMTRRRLPTPAEHTILWAPSRLRDHQKHTSSFTHTALHYAHSSFARAAGQARVDSAARREKRRFSRRDISGTAWRAAAARL